MGDTVKIPLRTMCQLSELARWQEIAVEEALERAIKAHYDAKFWEYCDKGYAAMRADPAVWEEVLRERREFDGTLMDGLDRNEIWHEDGTVASRSG